jgi:hypothetical protein
MDFTDLNSGIISQTNAEEKEILYALFLFYFLLFIFLRGKLHFESHI